MRNHPLSGVYAAALTPLNPDFSVDTDAIIELLQFLAARGCHGALLLGTTGEGPSFSTSEKQDIFKAAVEIRASHPDFRLLAGTGTPSLSETTELTSMAFELGFDGVVVLPPYYYRQADEVGLFTWFQHVIQEAVPDGCFLFGYHFPGMSGVPLSLSLLERLKNTFPNRFAGIKDSSGDPQHAQRLGEHFGSALTVLTGNDALFAYALKNHASGCITAMANLFSPDLRAVWDAHLTGLENPAAAERLTANRKTLSSHTPFPATIKALIAYAYGLPLWTVRPPLVPIPEDQIEKILNGFILNETGS